ncbi:class I SAM-dependent methyltransferase [Modestobacter sp. VKM Ac-2978]|uniref:class I SAM-dependent methyltransferase n=1 Tax=Modestobacter sp. VKM Ac-2978 TaxID=3004132 RepID=UPI0022AAA57A|nr:class I SAM-dependent methyltransferase [Modestobacter sp. VKM Ac-2978]MCZ2849286.1 class I SAM-dependent methyltransferase [Modestobacter sp. VKM Ac-2978]
MLTVDYDLLDVRPGMRVLDLGCGEGRHAFEAYRRGASVLAVDWGQQEVATTAEWLGAIAAAGEAPAGASAGVARGDLRCLPVPDASVDRVIASEVLEHIVDDRTALAEIARVLKPGGRVAVSVPRYGPERICWALSDGYHANEGGHIRIYRGDQLWERLAGAGLRPTDTHHAHALHAPYWWLKCAVGVDRDTALVRGYHRLLVWDLVRRPWLTRTAERLLDPLLGKSLVLYADKPAASAAGTAAGEAATTGGALASA